MNSMTFSYFIIRSVSDFCSLNHVVRCNIFLKYISTYSFLHYAAYSTHVANSKHGLKQYNNLDVLYSR